MSYLPQKRRAKSQGVREDGLKDKQPALLWSNKNTICNGIYTIDIV